MNKICYYYGGKGFGDNLICSQVVRILNDNGLRVPLACRIKMSHLVDVPIYNPKEHKDFTISEDKGRQKKILFRHRNTTIFEPMLMGRLRRAGNLFGQEIHFDKNKHNHIPVKYEENLDIPSVDVALCTKCGPWSKYREWAYFEQLKTMLDDLNITYIDLNENNVFNHDCLTYVKKCKLYVGLETGTSHYVSKFANNKALIIQSGYTDFSFWGYAYEYDFITANIRCPQTPCFLRSNCKHNRMCIDTISVEDVLKKILQKL